MRRVRRILHATDFSEASRPAFATALAWARRHRAELVLAHVLAAPQMVLEDSFISAKTFRQMEAGAFREASRRLERLRAAARRAGVRATTLVLTGVVFEQIARAAERRHADLIVIGTHGRSGLARLVLGSVAARVLALARCPVLTVAGR